MIPILDIALATCGAHWDSRLGIFGEHHDLDGLRIAGQVADHILQDLVEIDVEGRFGLLDLGPHLAHDFLDAPAALFLQCTEKSPVFASVTAARPSCSPVRREVLSTSGKARTIRSTWERTRSVS